MQTEIAHDLLVSLPVREARLSLTTRCNLRCVYCAVSQSAYRGSDMTADMAQQATAAILSIARDHKLRAVHVNGHGETTFVPGWVDVCRPLLDAKLPLMIITNLAKVLSTHELEVLGQMNSIAVSIDTADPDLLKRLRRRVDLHRIVDNINAIRKTAVRLGHEPPHFLFSCGLYDQNSLIIEDLARLAVSLGISSVGFWNLSKWDHESFPYQFTDVPERDRVYPLDDLSDHELRPRLEAIQRAITILQENRIGVEINGNFVNILADRLKDRSSATNTHCFELPKGMTRDCLDPWTYVEVDANGDVKPCCARGGVGNLRQGDLNEILNGEPIRRLRSDLLGGTPDPECARCRFRAPIVPAALQAKVRAISGEQELLEMSSSDQVEALLKATVRQWNAGNQAEAWSSLYRALALDPGVREIHEEGGGTIRRHLDRILSEARFPLTLSWLAAISRSIGDHEASDLLLRRYLELAPYAPDRDHVERTLAESTTVQRGAEHSIATQSWLWLRSKVRFRTRLRSAINRLQNSGPT
jgi:MoaA/NifB/PqqE/SkfB family radical SAM enzyme